MVGVINIYAVGVFSDTDLVSINVFLRRIHFQTNRQSREKSVQEEMDAYFEIIILY